MSMVPSVYPRVGGGTTVHDSKPHQQTGLSPRGRGNQVTAAAPGYQRGSIPAWAGEPWIRRNTTLMARVYPRVGGGTPASPLSILPSLGLSPRGRGNLLKPLCLGLVAGSIPAWAGEPRFMIPSRTSKRVYPRVGGGTAERQFNRAEKGGLSPRGRGNLIDKDGRLDTQGGLSLRGRGNPLKHH